MGEALPVAAFSAVSPGPLGEHPAATTLRPSGG